MRILDIYINGYRSLANVRWQPERLNVLIGPKLMLDDMLAMAHAKGLAR